MGMLCGQHDEPLFFADFFSLIVAGIRLNYLYKPVTTQISHDSR
jgi:hypothetical protein